MITCPQCEFRYEPAGAPGGHCPRCLLETGLGSMRRGGTEAWQPPPVAYIQALLPACEVLELLGRGGMGAVYRARQPTLDRMVAIKVLPPHADAIGIGYGGRFRNEARLLANLHHPGIVQVYEFGELPGRLLYFVMEYVDGRDLARLVAEQGPLPAARAARITADVCAALHCAHEAGVVHRDVKPANVLVHRDGRIKIADFGLAKATGLAARDATTGLVLGTSDYAAPESLVAGAAVDRRADLYAVGVMLHYMLTGEVPRGVFSPASERARGVGSAFDRIIARAMQQAPERRHGTAAELRLEIEHAAKEFSPSAQPDRRRGRLTLMAIAAAVALAVLGAGTLWKTVRDRRPEPAAQPGVSPGKSIPNAAAQRAAAEWVLAKGGLVTLEGETERRAGYWALPNRPFQVTEIYFENAAPIGGPLTDAELARQLQQLPALNQFIIVQSPGVAAGLSEASARLLASNPEIRDLGLDGVRLSAETVRRIGAMPKLRTLVLSHSPIHGDSLRPCAERLGIVSLTYCDIDAAAWRVIGAMPQLEIARFIGTPVDEAMIAALAGLKSLQRLGWRVDPATETALARIQQAHPGLTVRRFETWNTAEPPPLRPANR